jgi:predicted Zn-dependent peptidase
MRDDTPDDLVHDLFAQAMFPAHPLGREVLGGVDSITEMPRDGIASYHAAHYHPSNMVLAAAGNLTHEQLLDLVAARFPGDADVRPARPRPEPGVPAPVAVMARDTEQDHVVLGVRSIAVNDPDRYALAVMNQVLGGGMSSRLFQEVREQRGLAYSVFSYQASFDDIGFLALYAGTAPARVAETLEVLRAELDKLRRDALSDDELDAAKGHLTGSLAMSLESSASRMRRLGRAEMVEGDVPSLDEVVARIAAVGHDDIGRIIERVLADATPTLAVVGPHEVADFS